MATARFPTDCASQYTSSNIPGEGGGLQDWALYRGGAGAGSLYRVGSRGD